jgi:hypothetical protein
MRNAMILLTACILEWLGGLPDLDADKPVIKRLKVRSTVVPDTYPGTYREWSDWLRMNYIERR